jgi:hypothetical protein
MADLDSDYTDTDTDTDTFEVERVVDTRVYLRRPFLVKEKNFPDADNTWEPKEHLTNCDHILSEFLALRELPRRSRPHKPAPAVQAASPSASELETEAAPHPAPDEDDAIVILGKTAGRAGLFIVLKGEREVAMTRDVLFNRHREAYFTFLEEQCFHAYDASCEL